MSTPPLPVTVVIPHIASRHQFFMRFCWPSIKRNDPETTVVVPDEVGGGPARRRNHGAKHAESKYLFFCDDDVILANDCLPKLVEALDAHPAAGYAYCDYMGFLMPGAPPHRVQGPVFHMKSMPFNAGELRTGNYISTMSLIRRELFPGFDETLQELEDWDLWLTMLEGGVEGVYVPEVLFHAYYLDYGVSASANRNLHSAMNVVLNKHFPG